MFFKAPMMIILTAFLGLTACGNTLGGSSASTTDHAAPARQVSVQQTDIAADASVYKLSSKNGCRVSIDTVAIYRNPDGSIQGGNLTSEDRQNQFCATLKGIATDGASAFSAGANGLYLLRLIDQLNAALEPERPVLVEELLRPVATQPCFQLRQVLGLCREVGERNLV